MEKETKAKKVKIEKTDYQKVYDLFMEVVNNLCNKSLLLSILIVKFNYQLKLIKN